MRIVFMGTPEFAVPSLRALCEHGYEVAGVFTQPDRPRGRGNRLSPSPVKEYALSQGIPVFQPEKIRRDGVDDLRALAPDLCVTAAFGQILSQEILDIPPMGSVNVHASLLPRHRGSAPINWAILQGDRQAGVTTMMMARGIDTGDMLRAAATDILPGETAGELTLRLSGIGASLLLDTLRGMEDGSVKPIPQDEARMTYDPMLTKQMGIIDWTEPAQAIVNRIHGLNPWPGCSTAIQGGRMKLLRAKTAGGSGAPGEILSADVKDGLVIACGEGAVEIVQLQAPGGKPMGARDYLRGHALTVGTVLKEDNV